MITHRSPVIQALLVAAAMACASPGYADDVAVYESLDNVEIGAVFFGPDDRMRLDEQRRNKSGSRSGRKGRASNGRANQDAAGYIIGRAGKEQIYVRGDFVHAAVSSTMNFPGDVKITRTAPIPKTIASRSSAVGENETAEPDSNDAKE